MFRDGAGAPCYSRSGTAQGRRATGACRRRLRNNKQLDKSQFFALLDPVWKKQNGGGRSAPAAETAALSLSGSGAAVRPARPEHDSKQRDLPKHNRDLLSRSGPQRGQAPEPFFYVKPLKSRGGAVPAGGTISPRRKRPPSAFQAQEQLFGQHAQSTAVISAIFQSITVTSFLMGSAFRSYDLFRGPYVFQYNVFLKAPAEGGGEGVRSEEQRRFCKDLNRR